MELSDDFLEHFKPEYIEEKQKVEWTDNNAIINLEKERYQKVWDAIRHLSEYFIKYHPAQIEITDPIYFNDDEEESMYFGFKGVGINCKHILPYFQLKDGITEFETDLKIGTWLTQEGTAKLCKGYLENLLERDADTYELRVDIKKPEEPEYTTHYLIYKFGILNDDILVFSAEDIEKTKWTDTGTGIDSKLLIGKTKFPENKITNLVDKLYSGAYPKMRIKVNPELEE